MTFASELRGWSSHKALLAVQDFEIGLLENVKKCLLQRIKCDREYTGSLSAVISCAQKQDNTDLYTPFCQAWLGTIKELENIVQLVNEKVEKLGSQTVEKLSQIINNKKTIRKLYSEQRNRLELELYRLQEEVTKNRTEYESRLNKLSEYRAKYEEISNRGRTSTKLEELKAKYLKTEIRVHCIHNAYVISLCELNVYQQNYLSVTLPSLLDLQQKIQEEFARQCHEVLLECVQLTDWSEERFSNVYRKMLALVSFSSAQQEYAVFVKKFRSDPVRYSKQEFSLPLLNGPCKTINTVDIIVNDWTAESIQQSKTQYLDQLNRCHQVIGSRRQALREMDEGRIEISNMTNTSALRRELFEQQCLEEKYQALLNLITESLGRSRGSVDSNSVSIHGPAAAADSSDATKPVNQSTSQKVENGMSTPTLPTSAPSSSSSSAPQQLHQAFSSLRTAFTKKMANASVRLPKRSSRAPAHSCEASSASAPSDAAMETVSATSSDSITGNEATARDFVDDARNDYDESSASSFLNSGLVQRLSASNDDLTSDDIPERYQQVQLRDDGALEEEEWFHGVLPRDEVHRLLINDGDYLVRVTVNRASGEKQYVLSVMWSTHKHFIIQRTPQSGWHLEADAFPTIQQLLKHYQRTEQRVTRKSAAILKTAIARPDWQMHNDDLSLEVKIGSGQFGEVFRGTLRSQGIQVAIKTCRDSLSEEIKKKFLQEAHILQQYNHPNIVRFIGIAAQRHPVMIVMEYVSGGALLTYLRKRGSRLAVKSLVRMCRDAAAGMKYLSKKQCLHRDLAARNCLVDENEVVKISDFGMSREQQQYVVSEAHTQIPIKWTAPEALTFGIYTSASDVWSFGILMWEIFSLGAMPYPGLTNSQARDKVDQGYRMPPPDGAPDPTYSLMLQCWQHEPKDRPKFNSVFDQLCVIHSSLE